MPEILRIQGATRTLGKSQGYYGLPVRDDVEQFPEALEHSLATSGVTGPNTPVMATAWQFSPDELAALNAGAPLYVKLVGIAHPPIMLAVGEAVGMDVCPACNGCGWDNPAEGRYKCGYCNGSGGVPK